MAKKKICVVILLALACVALVAVGNSLAPKNYKGYIVYNRHYYEITPEPVNLFTFGELELIGEIQSNASKKILLKNKEFESDVLPIGTKVYYLKNDQNDIEDPNIIVVPYNGELKIARRDWTT